MAKNPNWTKEEDEIIKNIYENESRDKILRELPRRNWVGIQARASKIGVRRLNYFSNNEIDFIKKNYENMKNKEIGKKLNRSSGSILSKAMELGLTKKEKWTKFEDEFLKDNLIDMSANEMSSILNRSSSSIYHRIQELELQKKTPRYSNLSDDDIIKKFKKVSLEMGRTPTIHELYQVGLPSSSVFSSRFGSYGKACEIASLDINYGIAKRNKYFSENGDLCLSNAEKKITDFLIEHNIFYEKEILYSKITGDDKSGKMICDWLLKDGTVVEYFGMARHKKYKKKMERKYKICLNNDIKLISIFDKDLNKLYKIFERYM